MNTLTVATKTSSDGVVLVVAGDLDFASAPLMREALEGVHVTAGQSLVLDLGGMTFCDSGGLTALVAARHQAVEAGAEIVLAAVPDHTRRILKLVGLESLFVLRPQA
ncbi:STAS domain-containing protein [Amycolatopsis magusensis]|uniref:STAS domain-containing protein n=1 Tax=Amycolatopsis magusensis TaxID=882444 RepID=UPI0024A8B86C|nr:STAS domain-containing protein [Amycolatopsis magusensis]MDI5977919.1 STAS domain-containing protein [Amycolatopsis magusensis]